MYFSENPFTEFFSWVGGYGGGKAPERRASRKPGPPGGDASDVGSAWEGLSRRPTNSTLAI